MTTYAIGDEVRLTKDIYEPADDHSPAGYIARKGQVVIVRSVAVTKAWDLYVSHEDVHDNSFGVKLDEIEAIP